MPQRSHVLRPRVNPGHSQRERDHYVFEAYRGDRLLNARLGAQANGMSAIPRGAIVPYNRSRFVPARELVLEVIAEDGGLRQLLRRKVDDAEAGIPIRDTGVELPAHSRRRDVRGPARRVEHSLQDRRGSRLRRDHRQSLVTVGDQRVLDARDGHAGHSERRPRGLK